MLPDAVRVAETKGWLLKAVADLRAAAHDLAAQPPLTAHAVFNCQQSVEKALMALLCWHDTPFRKTHSLEELGEQCLRLQPHLRSLIDKAVPLTEYAWRFRYPGEPFDPSRDEAAGALGIAQEVFEAVQACLPPATHP